jgi:hypothetical protein
MKLRNLSKNWDAMPENAFDDTNVHYTEVYTGMYNYGVELEAEVRRQREVIEMYKSEIRALNKANARKAVRIAVVNMFRRAFPA